MYLLFEHVKHLPGVWDHSLETGGVFLFLFYPGYFEFWTFSDCVDSAWFCVVSFGRVYRYSVDCVGGHLRQGPSFSSALQKSLWTTSNRNKNYSQNKNSEHYSKKICFHLGWEDATGTVSSHALGPSMDQTRGFECLWHHLILLTTLQCRWPVTSLDTWGNRPGGVQTLVPCLSARGCGTSATHTRWWLGLGLTPLLT